MNYIYIFADDGDARIISLRWEIISRHENFRSTPSLVQNLNMTGKRQTMRESMELESVLGRQLHWAVCSLYLNLRRAVVSSFFR